MRRIAILTAATLLLAGAAANAYAAQGSALIGPFHDTGDGELEARLTATFAPDDPQWPWGVYVFQGTSETACAPAGPAGGELVLVTDSRYGEGTVEDTISVFPRSPQPFWVCVYAEYRNALTLLGHAAGTPPSDAGDETPDGTQRLPTLTAAQARRYTAYVLDRRFNDAWSYRAGGWIKCGRINRTRMRCRTAWAVGDTTFNGIVRIWRKHDRSGRPQTYYSLRIRRTNEYCVVTGGSHCSKIITSR